MQEWQERGSGERREGPRAGPAPKLPKEALSEAEAEAEAEETIGRMDRVQRGIKN